MRTIFDSNRHIDDQVALRRIEASIVDLDDPIALLLVELQDPSVEIVPFLSDVLLNHPGGQNKPAIGEIAPHKLRLNLVMNGEQFREFGFLLIVNILVGASIAQAEQLDRLAVALVTQGHLDPCPLVKRGFVDTGRNDRSLAARFQKIH